MNKILRFKIDSLREEASGIYSLRLTSDDKFSFKPGQFLIIHLLGRELSEDLKKPRPFSLSSSPKQKFLEITFKVFGPFTQKLSRLSEQDEIGIGGPYGQFIFNEEEMKKVVLIAGGIGISPFMSILRYAQDKNLLNKFFLIYSCKTFSKSVFHPELDQLQNNLDFNYFLTLTGEKREGLGYGRIKKEVLRSYLNGETYFFICGSQSFVDDQRKILLELRVDKKFIKVEKFY